MFKEKGLSKWQNMFKEKEISKKSQLILHILFICSLPFMTLLFLRDCDLWLVILSFFLSLIIGILLVKYVLKDLFSKIKTGYFLISAFFGIYIARKYFSCHVYGMYGDLSYEYGSLSYRLDKLGLPINEYLVSLIISVCAIFAIATVIYIFILKVWPLIKQSYTNLLPIEKKYLKVSLIVSFFVTVILYYFVRGLYYSDFALYDIYYTSDSSSLFRGDAFFNINMAENDLRQPLFGLLALPFALIAKICSEIFFFIPNGYAVFLTVIQIMLINASVIMITRLLKLNVFGTFAFILLYFCSFSTVVFSFIMEQYIIGLFYLILTIYLFFENKCKTNYAYLGAVSTLLTSGVLFPFISRFKNCKYWLKNVFKCFIVFVVILIIFGQLPQIFDIGNKLKGFIGFSGTSLSFSDKIMQYLSFVKSIFIAPQAEFILNGTDGFPGYRLVEITGYSFVGLGILLLCLISVIWNRKNKMAIVSGLWILFSFIILCVIGWGTSENGLILYSLYFSWAFIILIYLLIDKIIKNDKIKFIFIIVCCLILTILNIPEYINIIQFGLEYYGN